MPAAPKRWPAVATRVTALSAAIVLSVATCRDETAPVVEKPPVYLAQAIRCAVDHSAKTVKCTSGASGIASTRSQAIANAKLAAAPQEAPGISAAILGGQDTLVELSAVNISNDATEFSFDAYLRNLTPEPMGTHDGVTPDGIGIEVFFDQDPQAPVTIVGSDGSGTFTHSGEQYFQYDAGSILAANDSTFPENWGFDYNGPEVDFTFVVYVSTQLPNDPTPVPILAHTFTQISAGTDHACGIRTGDVVYCWGDNFNGEGGIGTFNTPTLLPLGSIGNIAFAQVSAGEFYSCGLDASGNAYCWGANDSAQLGDGSTGENVPSPVSSSFTYKQISAFGHHTCAVRTGAGDQPVDCWGANDRGQAGTGSSTAPVTSPTEIAISNSMFSQVTVGINHTCARKANNDVWCWGANDSGQVGNGTSGPDVLAPSTKIGGVQKFSTISAGASFTCAIDGTSSNAYCWGSNAYGQLGINSFGGVPKDVPTKVNGSTTFNAITTGWFHTCAIEVPAAHRAFCWGANDNGQLGIGSFGSVNDQDKPTVVTPTTTLVFTQISAGDGLTCAVTTGGVPYCWGEGDGGQIGDGNQNLNNAKPVAVAVP